MKFVIILVKTKPKMYRVDTSNFRGEHLMASGVGFQPIPSKTMHYDFNQKIDVTEEIEKLEVICKKIVALGPVSSPALFKLIKKIYQSKLYDRFEELSKGEHKSVINNAYRLLGRAKIRIHNDLACFGNAFDESTKTEDEDQLRIVLEKMEALELPKKLKYFDGKEELVKSIEISLTQVFEKIKLISELKAIESTLAEMTFPEGDGEKDLELIEANKKQIFSLILNCWAKIKGMDPTYGANTSDNPLWKKVLFSGVDCLENPRSASACASVLETTQECLHSEQGRLEAQTWNYQQSDTDSDPIFQWFLNKYPKGSERHQVLMEVRNQWNDLWIRVQSLLSGTKEENRITKASQAYFQYLEQNESLEGKGELTITESGKASAFYAYNMQKNDVKNGIDRAFEGYLMKLLSGSFSKYENKVFHPLARHKTDQIFTQQIQKTTIESIERNVLPNIDPILEETSKYIVSKEELFMKLLLDAAQGKVGHGFVVRFYTGTDFPEQFKERIEKEWETFQSLPDNSMENRIKTIRRLNQALIDIEEQVVSMGHHKCNARMYGVEK